MGINRIITALKEDTERYVLLALRGFIDMIFLVIWVVSQYLNQIVVDFFVLKGLDSLILVIYQIIFSIGTLIPVVCYVAKDSYEYISLTVREIRGISARNQTSGISMGIAARKSLDITDEDL